MEQKRFTGIVTYTLCEKESPLRDAFRNTLKEKLEAEPLDESTYGLRIGGCIHKDIIEKLKSICNLAEEISGQKFEGNGFVNFFYPTSCEESGKDRFIIQIKIR